MMRMIRSIRIVVLSALVLAGFGAALVGTWPVYAQSLVPSHQMVADTFQGDACSGISQLGGTGCNGGASGTVSNLLATVINILSLVAGIAAVIMIIIAGLRFITANGDSSGISSARSALIYALVGLIIVAMAQIIVHFVLGRVAGL